MSINDPGDLSNTLATPPTHSEDSATGASVPNKSTNGGAHVVVKSQTFPLSWYAEWVGAAGAADNALIYTSGDVSMYNYHTIGVTGTDAVDIEITLDGTNWSTAAAILLADDVTTGGGVKVLSIPTAKIGILRGKFKQIRVRQNGATDANAYGSHSVE